MAEPDNLILKLLRELRLEMNNRFDRVDERFDAQDKKIESMRQALQAETVLGRYAVLGVDERLDDREKRVSAIEAQR